MAKDHNTHPGQGVVIELGCMSPFERQVHRIPGPAGDLLRRIARAEADGRRNGMSDAESWRWSAVVVDAKKLARALTGGRR